MGETSNQVVRPFYTSKSQFGVRYENNFVFTDDGRHLIGVDGTDSTRVCVEDIRTGSRFGFGNHRDVISTLIFDNDSGTLLAGDWNDHVVQYDLDLVNKTFKLVRDFGDIGVGGVRSSFRFMQYVFFGGNNYKLKVFDLASKQMLPGHIETGVGWILSLQVCALDKSRILLAVVGYNYKYSSNQSDLYDLRDLMKDITTIPKQMLNPFENVRVSDLEAKEVKLVQAKKIISQQEDRITKLSNKNKSIFILEKKVEEMQVKMTQKDHEHQILLDEHQKLQKKYKQLKKDKKSEEETITVLLQKNEDLNKKLSEAESKAMESTKLQEDFVNQTKSLKSMLLQQKRKSDLKINGLLKKLSILNYTMKSRGVSSKYRQSKSKSKGKRKGTEQPDFADLIRSLEDRLGVKTQECVNIRNVLSDTLLQNTRHEEAIESKDKQIKTLTHRLTNTQAACTEG